MKTYTEFHGETKITDIGKRLREIVKIERYSFKILTGYGSTSLISKSKLSAIKSLTKMKKEGLIKGFLPGDIKHKLLTADDFFYGDKLKYQDKIKNDTDFGNDGIIFVFMN